MHFLFGVSFGDNFVDLGCDPVVRASFNIVRCSCFTVFQPQSNEGVMVRCVRGNYAVNRGMVHVTP